MLQVNEAQEMLVAAVKKKPAVTCTLEEAVGKIIAQPHKTLRVLPPWDNSAMDGFALHVEDTTQASDLSPTRLRIVDEVACGDASETLKELKSGEAVRIMTGAPVPPGANGVVIKEKVSLPQDASEPEICVNAPVALHANIRFAGEDVGEGMVVAPTGSVVTPALLSLLASAGYTHVEVHEAPVVAILASGSELVPLGQAPAPHQIVNSNAYAVAAALREAGAHVRLLGIAQDTLQAHAELLGSAPDADMVVSIGGVSMGEKDWVRPALKAIGAQQIFWKVAMRPGKPLVFARRGEQLFVGLPGNPVSALVGAELFLKPMVRQFVGQSDIFPAPLFATLKNTAPLKKRADFCTFFRAQVTSEKEGLNVTALTKQSSGQISGLAQANALLMTPVGPTSIASETVLPVLVFSQTLFTTSSSLKSK
jgi:molybdopterin molybdotransferase